MTNATRDWDAQTYDRLADPTIAWGARVLDRLPPRRCGDGMRTVDYVRLNLSGLGTED
jgi:hypothetical protein